MKRRLRIIESQSAYASQMLRAQQDLDAADNMHIRPFNANDAGAIIAVFHASVHTLAVDHYDEAQRAAWAPPNPDGAAWDDRLSRCTTLVAEGEGVIAGFLSYEQDGHIDLVYTAPAWARRGVASKLYAAAEASLERAGVTKLYAEVSLVARPFFDRFGFSVVEEQHVERRGATFRRFIMHKHLRS